MKRADVLEAAKQCVTSDRAKEHGDMEDNFATIASYWSIHLGRKIEPVDVGIMMALLKAARAKANPYHEDNYVDGAGYFACSAECVNVE
jgi:hypothetical protein